MTSFPSVVACEVVRLLSDIVHEHGEMRLDRADLSQVTMLVQSMVSNGDQIIPALEILLEETSRLGKNDRSMVVQCISRIYRNLYGFEGECARILRGDS